MAMRLEVGSKTLAIWALFVAFMGLLVTATKFGLIRPGYSQLAVEGAIGLLLGATLLLEGVAEGKLTLDLGTYMVIGVSSALIIYGLAAVLGAGIPTMWESAIGVLFAAGFGATIYEMVKK